MTKLDPSQARAVDVMTTASFGLVTGGPGTGKTTTLREACRVMTERGESFALAAPTGKAARRMSEATGCEAMTLHRMLGYNGRTFLINEVYPLEWGAVLVDEASMIGYDLGRALMAGACNSRIILVGDADQLPPVDQGRMFGDLVDAAARGAGGALPMARLTTQHRAAAGSWVARNAPRVLAGKALELEACADFEWVEVLSASDAREAVLDVCYLLDPDAIVLTPQYAGDCGADALNLALDPLLNTLTEADETISRGTGKLALRPGTRVIHTRNNYDLELMNGELGIINTVSAADLTLTFPDLAPPERVMTRREADALQPAYALTVHKTQGSEFGHVVVVCHSSHTHMLDRSILYTAITRAKRRVTLVGDVKGLGRALKTQASARQTSLVERVNGTLEVSDV
jgi:exodeoxyribonuclease V alpha subunit